MNEDSDRENQTSHTERTERAVARKSNRGGRKRGSISRRGSGWRKEAADVAWKKGGERAYGREHRLERRER